MLALALACAGCAAADQRAGNGEPGSGEPGSLTTRLNGRFVVFGGATSVR